jgi:vancomycin aglycone glucosyltransferase
MRVLLSTIGTRGDVQPLIALAMELRALEQDVRFCVPPDFQEWIQGLGFTVVPVGPELRKAMAVGQTATPEPLSPERRREVAAATVAVQFLALASAVRGCDVIVAAAAVQVAARSVAERLGIGYLFVAYCPVALPSWHHPPPQFTNVPREPAPAAGSNTELWDRDGERFADVFGAPLNAHRVAFGLEPVGDVRGHVFTDSPLLTADPVLAPWPGGDSGDPMQTGAWLLEDDRPLAPDLSAFLDAGDPPVYFGFGSMRVPQDLGEVMVRAARAVGRRSILSRGWAGLALPAWGSDCIAIDDVNHAALFSRVAAVVHHGGAGTTTAAALAAAPQVVVPQFYDQPYWAQRVEQLGIGREHGPALPTPESLTAALVDVLDSGVAARARDVAKVMVRDGARDAAVRLVRGELRAW